MALIPATDRSFLQAISQITYCNPFVAERCHYEKAALGAAYHEEGPFWSMPVEDPERPRTNIGRIAERLAPLILRLRDALRSAARASHADLVLYEDAVLHHLYQRYYPDFFRVGFGAETARPAVRWGFYPRFLAEWNSFFDIPSLHFPSHHEPRHTFACFRQIQRAFEQILRAIVGHSAPGARLRAMIWQSIFTHDIRRYRRTLFERMGEFATLITGPSGSGKELVARAIGQSRYVPFDTRRLAFADDDEVTFYPINISALSPTLVESELFGHKRGSFTGALADRKGWLETCPALGSVFLDELGELDPAIQVKLLRVIETRTFHIVGDTAAHAFRGKLIAATNRDLSAFIREGKFREDLYYRLCSDQIVTPSLADQIADSPAVLEELVLFFARRVAGAESDTLAAEVLDWIRRNLEPGYPWPGNYRELEQLVKNVLIRRDYRPLARTAPADRLSADLAAGRLTADELLSRYCALIYRKTGSYEETARRLGLDRRTVKAKITLSGCPNPTEDKVG